MTTRFFLLLTKKLEVFDSLAVRLTVWTGKSRYPVHPKHLVQVGPLWFEKYLERKDIVLDLGCDNGMHTIKAARKVKKIIGVDYQVKSLAIARGLAKDQKISNVEFQEGSLETKLSFPSGNFDKVLFLDVLEHLYHRSQIMAECHRVLKNNGLLLLSIPNSDTRWKKLLRKNGLNSFADSDHKIEYTRQEAIKVCQTAGFEVNRVDPITLDTPLAPIIGLVGGFSLSLYQKLLSWKRDKMWLHPEDSVGFRIVAQKI